MPESRTRALDLEDVEARVARARHRRGVAGWAAAGVTTAAVVALVVAVAGGASGPQPAPPDPTRTAEPVAAAPCGSPTTKGADGSGTGTFAVSLTSQTSVLTPDAAWVGVVTAGAAEPDATTVDLGALAPLPLLVRDGLVVATATDPGNPLAEGPSFAAARFVPCPGVSVVPGTYTVVVDQPIRIGDAEYRLVSNTVPVHVVTAQPAGYRPRWLAGSPLACGSTLDEVGARSGGATPAQLMLDSMSVDASGLTWSFLNPGAETVTYSGDRELGLMWVQDGVVRSVGPDLSPSDDTVKVPGQTMLRLSARWDTTDYCEPGPGGRDYPHHLPAGTYEVYAYARITPASDRADATAWFVQTIGPAYIRVGTDGSVQGR